MSLGAWLRALAALACGLPLRPPRTSQGSPERACASWGSWQCPSAELLGQQERALAALLNASSELLARDPQTRPMEYQPFCDESHLASCSWCPMQARARADAHAHAAPLDLADAVLTMIDDRALHAWAGVRRVMQPPQKYMIKGAPGIDYYCSAFREGDHFVLSTHSRVYRSFDGFAWNKTGGVLADIALTSELCTSHVEDGKAPPLYVGASLGRIPCTNTQTRLYSMQPTPHGGLRGKALKFGDRAVYRAPPPGCERHVRSWEMLASNRSLLRTGGDTCVLLYRNSLRGSDMLAARANYCVRERGEPRWRAIRGLEVREAQSARAMLTTSQPADDFWRLKAHAYLDLEGKADMYRVQLYTLGAVEYPEHAGAGASARAAPPPTREARTGGTLGSALGWLAPAPSPPPSPGSRLFIGVGSVYNFPKAADVPAFRAACAALRGGLPICDTIEPYLLSSRDGAHWDAGWVYARSPLVPRGDLTPGGRAKTDSGLLLPCGHPLFHAGQVWLYYLGFRQTHEERARLTRKASRPYLHLARWPLHALVGLEPPAARRGEAAAVGVVWTKRIVRRRGDAPLGLLLEAVRRGDKAARARATLLRPYLGTRGSGGTLRAIVDVRARVLPTAGAAGSRQRTTGKKARRVLPPSLCVLRLPPLPEHAAAPAADVLVQLRILLAGTRLLALGAAHALGEHAPCQDAPAVPAVPAVPRRKAPGSPADPELAVPSEF